jgi:RHS repeat-associated protein/uncharacterized repeat protein (TIGR01451 family)
MRSSTTATARSRNGITFALCVVVGLVLALMPVDRSSAAPRAQVVKSLPHEPVVESLGAGSVRLDPPIVEDRPALPPLPAPVDTVAPPSEAGEPVEAPAPAAEAFTFADRADAPAVVHTGNKAWSLGFGLGGAGGAAAEREGDTVTYRDALPDVDVVYEIGPDNVKELLRVRTPAAAARMSRVLSPLTFSGISPVAGPDGSVDFIDKNGKRRAYMPAGKAWDSASSPATTDVRHRIVGPRGDRSVASLTDASWLTAAERVFPVTIDPTLFVGGPPNAPVLIAPTHLSVTSTATPVLSATYSDPDADSGTCTFRVTDVLTAVQVLSSTSALVANNGTCQVTVGAGVLSNGRSYRYTATATDATGLTSGSSALWTFRVAVLPTVTKTRPSTVVARGETVPYTVTVSNPTSSAMRVNGLTDTVPTGLAANGVSVTSPGNPPTTCRADAAPPEPSCTILPSLGGAYRDVVAADAPNAWWRLDDPTGTTAADASGNAQTGTYVGARSSTPGVAADDLSTAASFNGTDAVVTVPHSSTLDLDSGTNFTIEGWVKTTATGSRVLASKMNEDVQKRGWQLWLENGILNFHQTSDTSTGNWVGARGVRALDDGGWHHVAVTRSASGGSGLTLWVDGTAEPTVVYQNGLTATSLTAAGLRIGARTGLNFYSGSLDEAALYRRTLTAAEIAEHATAASRTSVVRIGAFSLAPGASRTFTVNTVGTGATHPDGPNTGDCSSASYNELSTAALATDGYEQTVRADNPSEYFRLGDTAGTTATNAVGLSGLYSGGVTLGTPGAMATDPDRSPRFDGVNGHVAIPSGQADFTPGFSVSAWIYPTSAANGAKIVDFGNGAASDNVFLGRSGTTASIELGVYQIATLRTVTAPNKLRTNQWQHVGATIDAAGNGAIYYNGVLAASGFVGVPRNLLRLNNYIGRSNTATQAYWNGGQDEVAVYRTALGAARMKSHYEAGTSSVLGRRITANPVEVCENRLGIEPWWSYVTRDLGPGGTAKVNVSSGNLVVQQDDSTSSQTHGRLSLNLRRSYNSLDTGRLLVPNGIGTGWNLNIGQVDAGVTAAGLVVGTPTSAIDQVLQGLPATLVDRDGTRHVLQPKSLTAAVNVPLLATGPLAPKALVRGGTAVCVDRTYTAPPGLHLSMWRYVQVNGGTCSNTTAATSQVLGYAMVRPDRIRYEFSATGELVSTSDASGVELRYLYERPLELPLSGLPLALGRLEAVFEATAPSCKNKNGDGTVPKDKDDVPDTCRRFTFTWTGSPDATRVDISDAAGRATAYLLTGTSPNYLMGVDNPDGSTLRYTYQGVTWNGVTGSCFSVATGQLCSATDLAGHTTGFTYRAAFADGLNPNQRPVVRTIVDRRGTATSFDYNSGVYTLADSGIRRQRFEKIDAFGRVGIASEGDNFNNFERQTMFSWDGVADPTRPTPDVASPSTTRVGCRTDDKGAGHAGNVLDNNLCRMVRKAVVTPTHPLTATRSSTANDQDHRYLYNPEGKLLQEKQSDRAPTPGTGADPGPTYGIVTTTGWQTQYTPGTGATDVYRDVVAGNGGFQPFAARTAAATALYYVADRTESLTPRGNLAANASQFATYRTTVAVDGPQPPTPTTTSYTATPTAPNTFDVNAVTCGPDGTPTRNTGLVCETGEPGATNDTGTVAVARTQHRYNGYGQKISQVDPNVVARPGDPGHTTTNLACPLVGAVRRACYSYLYYDDAARDLSGSVSAGGWLKATIDPTQAFVAFAYDRAGNLVRTWDRNATASATAGADWHNTVTLPAPDFTENVFGPWPAAPSDPKGAYMYPWRWKLSAADQLKNKTTYQVDGNGNQTRITPPRGNLPQNTTDFDTVQQFDANDNISSRSSPRDRAASTSWQWTYDTHDNQTQQIDSLGRKTVWRYDSVNRMTRARWSRGFLLPTTPTHCPQASADPEGFTDGTNVCDTATGYDHLDNVVKTWDGNQNPDNVADVPRVTTVYDAAHRALRQTRLRNDGGLGNLVSSTSYDVDGNPVDACSPRQVSEGGTGATDPCPANPRFGQHSDYDPAGRVLRSVTVKNQAGGDVLLEAKTAFDDNGNRVKTTDANGHTTTAKYNVLDRRTEESVPRANAADLKTTTYAYSLSGDTTLVDSPGTTGTRRITTYAYDAAHRLTGKVVGAPSATSVCPQTEDATEPGSTSGCNIRTGTVYDADGHVVAQYDPRAFIGNPTTPNAEFMARTDFDATGWPTAQYLPRYAASGGGNDPGINGEQATHCPASSAPQVAGTPDFPAGVGVCVTRAEFDRVGNRTKLVLPTTGPSSSSALRTINYTYTSDNLIETESAPNPARNATDTSSQVVTTHRYDGNAQSVLVDMPRGIDGQPRQQVTTYTADNLVKTLANPKGTDAGDPAHTMSSTYNANGQVTAGVDGNGRVTTATYHTNGWTQESTQGSGTPEAMTTRYAYDNVGNTTGVFSPSAVAGDKGNPHGGAFTQGLATVNRYTFDNLLLKTYQPVISTLATVGTGAGSTWRLTSYAYDDAGRKTSVNTEKVTGTPGTDTAPQNDTYVVAEAAGAQAFTYYASDRLRTESGRPTAPGGTGTITTGYDPAGNPTSMTDTTNTTPTLGVGTCDANGNVVGTAAPASTICARYYADNLVRNVDDGAWTNTYSYDGSGMANGRRDRDKAASTDYSTTYANNDAGMTTSVESYVFGATPRTTTRTYDPVGRPRTQTDPNPATGTGKQQSAWSFNPDDTLERLTVTKGGLTLADWTYTYNGAYQQLTQGYVGMEPGGTTSTPARNFTYQYNDGANRLTSFTDVAANVTKTAKWDHNSNRLGWGPNASQCGTATAPSPDTTCFTYNADDSIAKSTVGTADKLHTQNAFGGMILDDCTSFVFDGFDRLKQANPIANNPCTQTAARYTYDALDRQRERTDDYLGANPVTTRANYDGFGDGTVAETPTAAGSNPTLFELSPDGSPLAYRSGTEIQFLTGNGQGDITTLTSDTTTANAVACTARFDPFGIAQQAGATPCNSTNTKNDFFYRGARRDKSTGQYQFGSRQYDPRKSGFLTPDSYRTEQPEANLSIGIDPLTRNTFGYVNGDPVNLYDLDGHKGKKKKCNAWCRARGFGKGIVDAGKDFVGGVAEGTVAMVESTVDMVVMGAKCAPPNFDCAEAVALVKAVATDPIGTVKTVVKEAVAWDDMADGNYAKGAGKILPNIVAALVTKGGGSVAKAAKAGKALKTARNVDRVVPEEAAFAARVSDDVPKAPRVDGDDAPNIVYRAVNDKDVARLSEGLGLEAKNPSGQWSLGDHVKRGSSPSARKNDPWISTTSRRDVAEAFNSGGGGHGIVAIDLNKVPSLQLKAWEHYPRVNGAAGLPYHYSIWQQEISVFQRIPQEAIIGWVS